MPVPWRLHVLEERLRDEIGEGCVVEAVELLGLPPLEQSAALDAMIAQSADLPITLVNGVFACAGDIEVDRIVAVARLAKKE